MQSAIDVSALPKIQAPGRIAILKSKWYPDLVQNMANACVEVLTECGYSQIEQHTLPGSLEIPLAARDLLATDLDSTIDAVICFGIIVKGETLHFEMISAEAMRGLGEVMHEFRRPVVVEILPVFNMQQAQNRAGDNNMNKGYEAAACAIEMVAWRQSIGATAN